MPNCWWFFVVVAIAVGAGAAGERRSAARRIGLTIGPETTIIDGPLTADGLPDYVTYLNSKLSRGIEPEDNFWAQMWIVFGRTRELTPERAACHEKWLGIRIPGEGTLKWGLFFEQSNVVAQDQAARAPWTRDQFPQIAAWIDSNADALDKVARAAERSRAFTPLCASADDGFPLAGLSIPHVQPTFEVGRLLAARAMLRLGEGDVEGAWRDVLTCHRIARHMDGGWTAFDLTLANAVRSRTAEALVRCIAQSDGPPAELEWRLEELKPLLRVRPLAEVVDSEAFIFVDTILAIASGAASPETLSEFGLLRPRSRSGSSEASSPQEHFRDVLFQLEDRFLNTQLLTFRSHCETSLREGIATYAEVKEALSRPEHLERQKRLIAIQGRFEEERQRLESPGALLTEFFESSSERLSRLSAHIILDGRLPSMASCEVQQTRGEARSRVLLAAMKIKMSLAGGAAVPARWSDLALDPTELTDPFDGEPLRLRRETSAVVIYSVGPNGNDDDGRTEADSPRGDDIRAILRLR
ncbi:hypothetical protein [Planctomyces sp. SH-PL14]|uniref:hypothetical protein n=1 Tax=Planctomyces sp. SH-PL14 TaxID=1632864 RepID=UPI00078C15BA|nr:hypothetical protein [Planctomyces sp. SH-PL14]AMV20057.1 hypothetical protein VT03_19335 [Planctomyces sp. SH-PL14]